MVNTHMNTDGHLFQDYLKKEVREVNVGTDPILFGTPTPEMCTIMVQTEPQIDEYTPEEPIVMDLASEAITLAANYDTASNGSL
jgi:hypothetical protein